MVFKRLAVTTTVCVSATIIGAEAWVLAATAAA
jgi:hypothetical protein